MPVASSDATALSYVVCQACSRVADITPAPGILHHFQCMLLVPYGILTFRLRLLDTQILVSNLRSHSLPPFSKCYVKHSQVFIDYKTPSYKD